MESLTWIAVVITAINTIDSITTKVLNALQKMKEDANKTALALRTAEIAAATAKVETKVNQTVSDIATVKTQHMACQEELSSVKTELASIKSSAEAVHKEQSSRISEVSNQVVAVAAAIPPTQLTKPPS